MSCASACRARADRHRRLLIAEIMWHQAGMIAPLLQNSRDHRLLGECGSSRSMVLDCHPRLHGQRCRALGAHDLAASSRTAGSSRDADPVGVEIPCHPIRIANTGQRPGDRLYGRSRTGSRQSDRRYRFDQRLAHAVPPMTLSLRQPTPDLLVPASAGLGPTRIPARVTAVRHCEFPPAVGRPALDEKSCCHASGGTVVIPAQAGTQPLLITCLRPGSPLSR